MAFNYRHTQQGVRTILFRVTGTGTAVIDEGNSHATLTDNGTGDYTLTFTRPSARTPVLSGQPCVIGSSGDAVVSSVSTTAVRVLTFAADGTTATDKVFHLQINLFDVPSQA